MKNINGTMRHHSIKKTLTLSLMWLTLSRVQGFVPRYSHSKTASSAIRYGLEAEDIYAAIHRKEYEMKKVNAQHTSTTDPVRMAMSYAQETASPMRLARALRRVHEDVDEKESPGLAGMRRASFIVDIKRKSLSRPGEVFCNFDDAGMVAEAMVRLGADAVIVNTDFAAYGGDITELKSAVKAVRKVSKTAAVIMKDIVVDEIQLGMAKEAGADGIILQSCVLGPALDSFLDLATFMGLETIVECHTRAEVERALEVNVAPTILINNHDRITGEYYPDQGIKLAGLFPGSGGPIITLCGGGIETIDDMKRHLVAGFDGVIVGKAVMGSPLAPEFIRAVRDRTLLPAEIAHWAKDAEFDLDGNLMPGPKSNIPSPDDPSSYQ
jgi:indole-3-glycerol phosphate synthase